MKHYTISITLDDEGDTIARLDQWQGCVAHGATLTEAMGRLVSMMDLWLHDTMLDGGTLPPPDAQPSVMLDVKP